MSRDIYAADPLDQACARQQQEIDSAVANRVIYEGESADNCVECGSQIPSARQIAVPGVDTCVPCAAVLEHRAKHQGGAR